MANTEKTIATAPVAVAEVELYCTVLASVTFPEFRGLFTTMLLFNVLYVVQHFCATQFVYCPFPYCAAC